MSTCDRYPVLGSGSFERVGCRLIDYRFSPTARLFGKELKNGRIDVVSATRRLVDTSACGDMGSEFVDVMSHTGRSEIFAKAGSIVADIAVVGLSSNPDARSICEAKSFIEHDLRSHSTRKQVFPPYGTGLVIK